MYLTSDLSKHHLLPPVQPGHHDLHRVSSLRPPGLQELLAGRQLSKDNRLWEPLVMWCDIGCGPGRGFSCLVHIFPASLESCECLSVCMAPVTCTQLLFDFQVRTSAAPWSENETLASRMGCLPCAIDVHPHNWAINAGSGSRDL